MTLFWANIVLNYIEKNIFSVLMVPHRDPTFIIWFLKFYVGNVTFSFFLVIVKNAEWYFWPQIIIESPISHSAPLPKNIFYVENYMHKSNKNISSLHKSNLTERFSWQLWYPSEWTTLANGTIQTKYCVCTYYISSL